MEGNDRLLMQVLNLHYKDNLKILDEVLKTTRDYTSKVDSSNSEYNLAKSILQGLLVDLPQEVLSYFLSLIPLPKDHDTLEEDKDSTEIRKMLLKYLHEEVPKETIETPKLLLEKVEEVTPMDFTITQKAQPVLAIKRQFSVRNNTIRKTPKKVLSCKKLLDICAEYVIENEQKLSHYYKAKNDLVWKMIKSNKYQGERLNHFYSIIRDVNKKMKWMRQIDSKELTDEIITDEYGNSDIFIKEKHLEAQINSDPFKTQENLQRIIDKFVFG